MKDLIIEALDEAIIKLNKIVPEDKTKREIKTISIADVSPLEIVSFMERNNIPKDAYFSGEDNGYDGWDDIVLAWTVDVPMCEEEKLKLKRKRFTSIAFFFVYNKLTANGYTRVGYNSGFLKEFNDTTVYDMYVNKDYDRLVKYYSLPFKKV